MVTLVYPEHREVSEDTLFGWYADAVVNMECAPGARTIEDVCAALSDAGIITVSTAPYFHMPCCPQGELLPDTGCTGDPANCGRPEGECGCAYSGYEAERPDLIFERAIGDGNDVGG